jgi:hypothetical protein
VQYTAALTVGAANANPNAAKAIERIILFSIFKMHCGHSRPIREDSFDPDQMRTNRFGDLLLNR